MILSGTILESKTNAPVPYANVTVITADGDSAGLSTSADKDGKFVLNGYQVSVPNYIAITAAEFEPVAVAISAATSMTIKIDRKVKQLDEVVIHSGGKKNNLGWLLLIPVAMALTKKKAVGKIDTGTVVAVGVGLAFIKGFGLLNELLSSLGIGKDKDDKNFEAASSNPNSPFKPAFFENAPKDWQEKVKTQINATRLGTTLIDSWGSFNDNEEQAIGVFKTFKTKLQVSYFCYVWEKIWGYNDMLLYLRGGTFPNDRLDTGEIAEIINYVNSLPDYK